MQASLKLPRFGRRNTIIIAACLFLASALYLIFFPQHEVINPFTRAKIAGAKDVTPVSSFQPRLLQTPQDAAEDTVKVICRGPFGRLLSGGDQDVFHSRSTPELQDVQHPPPTVGSFDLLGLERSWTAYDQRYGAYGYSKSKDEDSRGWSGVDWGQLQKECFAANTSVMPSPSLLPPRFRLFDGTWNATVTEEQTGRQAVVLRAWSSYIYTSEDMWHIRSLITEAGLATNGQYTVVLLVDVHSDVKNAKKLHTNPEVYDRILQQCVPAEFHGIALLYHKSLQKSWYPLVKEYTPLYQIMQPLQLFAHFYPEFDHYWQFEMDTRFTGHVGQMLQSFHSFGATQPSKQSRERASWHYMESAHGTYANFSTTLNTALNSTSGLSGPITIPDIHPLYPTPPTSIPNHDIDPDLLLLSPLNEVRRFRPWDPWRFSTYIHSFSSRTPPPTFMSVPAQARASWNLLHAIHLAQHERGLAVAGEATLPSFAMWHGMKVVGVPVPKFQAPERGLEELDFVLNGGSVMGMGDGIADGVATYEPKKGYLGRPLTWGLYSDLPDEMYSFWREGGERSGKGSWWGGKREMPWFIKEVEGEVYVPTNLLVHPRKTNPA